MVLAASSQRQLLHTTVKSRDVAMPSTVGVSSRERNKTDVEFGEERGHNRRCFGSRHD